MEYEDALGLNLYEMDFRSYDPAIARFNGIDPVVHHSQGTSVAFDNNPVFWADPSGANAQWGALWLLNASLGGDDREWEDVYNANKEDEKSMPFIKNDEFVQIQPDRIDFVNTKTKEEKDKFLNNVIEWFGHVDKYGSKSIHVGSIIDFYAEPKVEKSRMQKFTEDFKEFFGGTPAGTLVVLNDGEGNYVEIAYREHTKTHADIYSGSSFDTQKDEETFVKGVNQNVYKMDIRSHNIGGGKAHSVISMFFYGKNKNYYNKIYDRIKAYKPYKVKITPYKKL